MNASRLWSATIAILGIIVSSVLFYPTGVPRHMFPADSHLYASILFVMVVAFTVLHSTLASKRWPLELCCLIVVSPIAIITTYLLYEYLYDRELLANGLKLVKPRQSSVELIYLIGYLIGSPYTVFSAIFGGIAGAVMIGLDRWLKPLIVRLIRFDLN